MKKTERDDDIALVEYMNSTLSHPGTTTANYHGFNAWTSFIVKRSNDSLKAAQDWAVQGLFISLDDIKQSPKPYITIFYVMGCGAILTLSFRKNIDNGKIRFPKDLIILQKSTIFKGEDGFKVHLVHWHEVGNTKHLVMKKGTKKKRHLARRVMRPSTINTHGLQPQVFS